MIAARSSASGAADALPEVDGPDGDRFTLDVAEVVHTHLNPEATLPVVEWWTPAADYAASSAPDRDSAIRGHRPVEAAVVARANELGVLPKRRRNSRLKWDWPV